MSYTFKSDVKASELMMLTMDRIYHSPTGVVNAVFTIAMVLLTCRFYGQNGLLLRTLMILAVLLFPVLQPVAIMLRSIRQVEDMPKDVTVTFDDSGVHISAGGKSENLKWKKIVRVQKRKGMIIVMSDGAHGYMFMDRETKDRKDEFYNYLVSKLEKNRN